MRRWSTLGVAAVIATSGCSAEVSLGASQLAAPADACQTASDTAVAAVLDGLAQLDSRIVHAYLVRVSADEKGFLGYPTYIFAAKFVTADQEQVVGSWSLGDSSGFRPIYPLDATALALTSGDEVQPDSYAATHLQEIADSGAAISVKSCAQG